jgi:hypothetical protein
MDRRHALTTAATLALVASALVGAVHAVRDAGGQVDRFAGRPPSAGLDAAVARFVPVPAAFVATVDAAAPTRRDRFYLAFDSEGDAPMGRLRPWVLSLAVGRAMLPAIRTVDRADATLVVTLGRPARPGPASVSDPAGTFTITRVARGAG